MRKVFGFAGLPGSGISRLVCFGLVIAGIVSATARPRIADTPVTPNASPEAQSLLAFLSDTYGNQIISGQQEGWRGTNDLAFELSYIRDTSGKLPALLAMDLSHYTSPSGRSRRSEHKIANNARDWYEKRNGIVSLCWHWVAPLKERAFYTKETSFSAARAVSEGTEEHAAALRDIDRIAAELKLLQQANVPVLWRPLHEANGRWFWWGGDGPDAFRKLWRMMFERLVVHHKLNNLIWVFSPGAGIDLGDWYPGDPYVDIIAPDHYPMDGNNEPAKGIYDEMVALGGGTKLVGFGENGPIPAPDKLVRDKADWLFFIAWSGKTLTDLNTKEAIRTAYNHEHVLTLSDLPDLKNYRFAATGKPAKLAFPAGAADMARGSVNRRPIVVAVQDEHGRTVRSGAHSVTLDPADASGCKELSGTRTVTTVNGLAVFADLAVTQSNPRVSLRATGSSLKPAVSSVFAVGPGSGILRECWTSGTVRTCQDAASAETPADSTVILGKAFEAPYRVGTNFAARYTGYLLTPMTGDYTFWIASEGRSELWLSTSTDPAQKVKIAEIGPKVPYGKWPHTHEAQSAIVKLEAGKRYYLEALQSQPSGSSHFSVRWKLPNGLEERPIPGSRLATIDDFAVAKLASTPR